MNPNLNPIDWLSYVLAIIGGINWGLIGFFDYNLVDSIFGENSTVSRIIYGLVGLAALYLLLTAVKLSHRVDNKQHA